MRKFRVVLLIAAIVIIIADLILIDYSNLTWSKNLSSYLGIIAMGLLIFGMIMQIRQDKK